MSKKDIQYAFKGVEVRNGDKEYDKPTYFFLNGSAYIDSGQRALGDFSINFRIPVSETTILGHGVEQLRLLTLELMRQAIQEESLREWLESQSGS